MSHFYVASRGNKTLMTHATAAQSVVRSFRPRLDSAAISAFLEQPEVSFKLEDGASLRLSTVRIVSLSPSLISAIVPSSFGAKQFVIEGGLSCSVLHCDRGVLIGSCHAIDSVVEWRRRLGTRVLATIRFARGMLEKCSSVAVLGDILSFNVEKNSLFGELVANERPGQVFFVSVKSHEIQCTLNSVSVAGDHLLLVLTL